MVCIAGRRFEKDDGSSTFSQFHPVYDAIPGPEWGHRDAMQDPPLSKHWSRIGYPHNREFRFAFTPSQLRQFVRAARRFAREHDPCRGRVLDQRARADLRMLMLRPGNVIVTDTQMIFTLDCIVTPRAPTS